MFVQRQLIEIHAITYCTVMLHVIVTLHMLFHAIFIFQMCATNVASQFLLTLVVLVRQLMDFVIGFALEHFQTNFTGMRID